MEPVENKNIAEYYNDFLEQQKEEGVNIRHRTIMHYLKKAGLKPHHNVLEIGCGIGTLTSLMQKYLNKGKILAVDISPKSIEYAKKSFENKKNVEFIVSDMQNFSHPTPFDFFVLPDVIEHIPESQHKALFSTIKKMSHQDSKIFINYPSPKSINYFRRTHPEYLQIIDQEIEAQSIIRNVESAGFCLDNFQVYSICNNEEEYVRALFKTDKPLQIITRLSSTDIILKEIKLWFHLNP